MKKPDILANAAAYADLFKLPEDERIRLIGQHALACDLPATIIVEDEPGKRDRYRHKLLTQFPLLEAFEEGEGPIAHTLYFKVRKKAN